MLGDILSTTAQRLPLGKIRPIPLLSHLLTGQDAKNRASSPQATAIRASYLNDGRNTSPVHSLQTR